MIGQQIAKRRLGRPTFSRALKARASLQKLQNRFKGAEDWPGSPSTQREDAADDPESVSTEEDGEKQDKSSHRVNRTLDFF